MKKKEIEEYIKSKSVTQDTYVAPTVQTHIDNRTPAMLAVAQTVKPQKSVLDKVGYLGKNIGAGVLRAGTGTVDTFLQDTQSDLQKGAKRDKNWYVNNAITNLIGTLVPGGSFALNQIAKNFDKEYQKKNIGEKILENINDLKEATMPPGLKEAIRTYGTFDKEYLGGRAGKNVEKISNIINKPSEDLQKSLAQERKNYGKLLNYSGDVLQQVGYMAPSIATTAITKDPNLGLAAMGVGARGSSTREALEQGATLDQAINIGNAKAAIEVGTEKLTGGLNFFGQGALDDIALKGVDKAIRNKGLNFLAKQGLAIVGEQGEEVLADVLGTLIDKGTINPNANYTWDDLKNTLAQTAGSTVLLNLLGGSYSPSAYRQNALEMQNTNNTSNTQNNAISDTKVQDSINTQQTQENVLNNTIDSKNSTLDKVKNLNEAERQALTEITIKRKNGISLDQNDIATINYLNNKDNDLSLSEAMEKAETDLEQGNVNYVNDLMNNLDEVNIEGIDNIGYNQEKGSDLNGEKTIESQNDMAGMGQLQDSTSRKMGQIIQDDMGGQVPRESNFRRYEETAKSTKSSNLTENQRKLADDIKSSSGKNIIFYDGDGKFYGGASTENSNDIYIPRYKNDTTQRFVANHEIAESEIFHNKDLNSKAKDIIDEIISDKNFEQAKQEFIGEQENLKTQSDYSIAKDMLCDFYSEQKTNINKGYQTNFSENTIDSIKYGMELIDNSLNKRTSDSSFSNENIPALKEGEPYIKTTGEEGELYWKDQGVNNKVADILSEMPQPEKVTMNEKIKNGKATLREEWQYFKRNFVDKGEAVYTLGKKTKNPNLYAKYDKMGTTRGEANYDIGVAQTDNNGNRFNNFTDKNGKKTSMSLNEIWDGVDTKAANDYIAHWLNVDRYGQLNEIGRQVQQELQEQVESGKMTQEDVNKIIQNVDGFKYVFGTSEITPEISKQEIAKLEKQNPELKRFGENVWQWGKNQLQTMVESGKISQAQAEQYMKETPHYVPLRRNVDTGTKLALEFDNKGKVKVDKLIKEFKGSNLDILPFKETMANYTMSVRSSNRANLFAQELAKTMGISSTDGNIASVDDIMGINPEFVKDNGNGTYSLTFYNEGIPTTIPINEGIYEALQPNKHYKFEDKLLFKGIRKVDNIRKALLTDKNPMFLATNMMKDAFDAPLNSKYPAQFVKNYPRAVKEILTNGKYYQQYQALGGLQNTYFENKTFQKQGSKLNPLTWIEKGNNAVEQFPRLAEFISTMEATGNIDQAMYNAAEITTNFKRGGNITKAANRNGATFLNASVQGFSKQIRNFTDIQSPRQAVQMLGKVVALGIAPGLLNDLLWDDDDEYKEMQEYQKDRYYLFKGKDGNWIRIPKGRAVSIFQSAARRAKYYLKGDKKAFDGFVAFATDQIAPNNPLDNNILSPFVQVAANKSWSGNPIVSDSIKNKEHPEEEYTIKTDEFSKWLGKKLGKSPAKINYLIDQYSGAIGDLVLPNITKKATRDSDNLLENIFLSPFKDKFTTNAITSSKSQNDFYEALEKAEDDKKWSKATTKDKAIYKYLYSKNSEISKIRKEYVESQESDMSTKEKYKKAMEYTKEMNKVAKEAVEASKNVKKNDSNQYEIGGKYYAISGNDVNAIKDETVQQAKQYGLSLGDYTDITSYKSSLKGQSNQKEKFINYVEAKEELTKQQKINIIKKYYKSYKGE